MKKITLFLGMVTMVALSSSCTKEHSRKEVVPTCTKDETKVLYITSVNEGDKWPAESTVQIYFDGRFQDDDTLVWSIREYSNGNLIGSTFIAKTLWNACSVPLRVPQVSKLPNACHSISVVGSTSGSYHESKWAKIVPK